MRAGHLVAAVLLTAGIAIAGCSSATPSPPAAPAGQDGTSIAAGQQSNGAIIPGYTLTIPKLGSETSTLVGLGLNSDRTIQVPTLAAPMQAGVYTGGPLPGQNGPAVVLAHVNAGGHPGFGDGFHTLVAGDVIDTATPTGPVRFTVYRVATFAKSAFPTASTYSDTPGPELRLITCGPGALDSSGHNYLDQTIVWARRA